MEEYAPLSVGQRVRANFDRGGEWFVGTIASKRNVSGADKRYVVYDVYYDDGDYEEGVARRDIAPVDA